MYKLHHIKNNEAHFSKGGIDLGFFFFEDGMILPIVHEHCTGDDLLAFGKQLNALIKVQHAMTTNKQEVIGATSNKY